MTRLHAVCMAEVTLTGDARKRSIQIRHHFFRTLVHSVKRGVGNSQLTTTSARTQSVEIWQYICRTANTPVVFFHASAKLHSTVTGWMHNDDVIDRRTWSVECFPLAVFAAGFCRDIMQKISKINCQNVKYHGKRETFSSWRFVSDTFEFCCQSWVIKISLHQSFVQFKKEKSIVKIIVFRVHWLEEDLFKKITLDFNTIRNGERNRFLIASNQIYELLQWIVVNIGNQNSSYWCDFLLIKPPQFHYPRIKFHLCVLPHIDL